MARIREYNNTQDIDPRSLEQSAYRVERTGMIAGQAWQHGFQGLAQGTSEVEKAVAQSETSDLSKKLSDLDLNLTQQYEDARQKGDPLNPEFANNFVSNNVDAKLQSIGDGLMTKQGQQMFQEASARMRESYMKRGIADQATFAGDAAVANYKNSVTNYSNLVTNDPTIMDHAAGMIKTLTATLPAEHRDEYQNAGLEAVYGAGAKSYLDAAIKNPNANEASLDAAWSHVSDPKNGFVGNVNPDTYSALEKQYLTAKETLGATQAEIASQNLPDLLQRIKANGGNDTDSEAQNIIDGYKGRTPAETQEWQARATKALGEAKAFGTASASVMQMPEPQALAAINKSQLDIDNAGPGDLGAKQQAQQAMIAAIQQRDKAFRSDPTGYVIGNSPVVNQRYQDFAQNPTPQSFQAYAQSSMAEQRRLYPDFQPKIVTSQMEQQVSGLLAGVPNTPEGATQAASTINSLATTMGPYWSQASQELFHDKVLNETQFVAANMWSNPKSVGLAQDLLRASATPAKDLEGTSGISEAKAQKAARDALAPLAATLGDAANGSQLMSAYTNSLAKLAQYKGTTDGVAAMANKMIMGEYQFIGSLRMPLTVNAGNVVAGTKVVMGDIPNHNISVPTSYSGTGPADQKAEYIRSVQEYGHWATNSQGDAALLYDEQGTPVYETIKGSVRQVAVPFTDLDKIGGGTPVRRVINAITGG